MSSDELQLLLQSTQGQANSSQQQVTDQINAAIDPLMPYLQFAIVIGIILTIIIMVYFTVNIIQKQRQHSAIMRIDKNLQRLVDNQLPTSAIELTEIAQKDNIEQN